ncbi:MAG: two component transcriptional regulator, AraC family [Oscillospiraceae bacterium]|jgi:two-component system response regulator YesN|nr:two component transcriptional regulator, AraC family [Oscillospiraceae bacterium]
MFKLLLADDEPLSLIGLQSMLKWGDYDISICGIAHNGKEALELIHTKSPDIVIIDIKMPLANGLEVLKSCREKDENLPLFIMLTSYEEFAYVKEAIKYQALDYLVKMELTSEILENTILKAISMLRTLKKDSSFSNFSGAAGIESFYEKFFIRLYNNLFESREQFDIQRKELGLDFSFFAYTVCCCEICSFNIEEKKRMLLYSGTLQMIKETINKFMACYITGLDTRHFNITFCISEQEDSEYIFHLKQIIERTALIVHNYFNVDLLFAVGEKVSDPFDIGRSCYTARQILTFLSLQKPILFFEEAVKPYEPAAFDFSAYKKNIAKAFNQLDPDALKDVMYELCEHFSKSPSQWAKAMDAACTLMYMANLLLPDGEELLKQIFSDEADGYHSIYRKQSVSDITAWMKKLGDGLCEAFLSRRSNYKNRIISNVQKYIRENLNKKLSLNEVAALFGFSPNYLSQLFTRCTGISFVEYITLEKISAAKKMMSQGNDKIYEIADKLGFESAFYFSKVFKKIEGISPREYIQLHISTK